MLIGLNEKSERIRATKNAAAVCPECKESLIPKCGDIKIWHWAHKHESNCWYSAHPMTLFHLAWQDLALKQGYDVEVNFKDDSGKIIHRADILTKDNRIIEIQHSDISSKEMIQRSEFYKSKQLPVDWIIDDNKRYKEKNFCLTSCLHPTTKQIQPQIFNKKIPRKYSCLFDDEKTKYGKVIMDFGGLSSDPLTHKLFLIHNLYHPRYIVKCNRVSYELVVVGYDEFNYKSTIDDSGFERIIEYTTVTKPILRDWLCPSRTIACDYQKFLHNGYDMKIEEIINVFGIKIMR